jgi:hypothetical protein
MEPSIESENRKSNKRKRGQDVGRLERDLQRWQRKRATIEKYKGEKFRVPKTDRGVELRVHNLKAKLED